MRPRWEPGRSSRDTRLGYCPNQMSRPWAKAVVMKFSSRRLPRKRPRDLSSRRRRPKLLSPPQYRTSPPPRSPFGHLPRPKGREGEAQGHARRQRSFQRDNFLSVGAGEGKLADLSKSVIPSLGPVGGRLTQFCSNWATIVTSDKLVNCWVEKGINMQWLDQPPPLRSQPWHFPIPADRVKHDRLRSEVKDLLAKRAIEETKEHRGYYSQVFLVPKQTGGWRPVFDLSNLNRYLIIPRFNRESALTIQRALRRTNG